MYNETLPISSGRRRGVAQKQDSVIVEDYRMPQMNDNLQNAIADNLANIVEIARSVVSIREIEVKTQSQIALLNQQQEVLRKEAEKFVMEESARRQTIESRGNEAIKILQELRRTLNESDDSDDIKREVIRVFSQSLDKI